MALDNAASEPAFAQTAEIVTEIPQIGVIEVSGTDAETFLAGQLTGDMRGMPADRSRLSGWCTSQGRVIAVFRITRIGDTWHLLLPRETVARTATRLQRYVLRAQVRIADATATLFCLGVSGPASATRLVEAGLRAVPAEVDAVAREDGLTVVRIAGPQLRFLVYGEGARVAALRAALASQSALVGPQAWTLLDIEAALPSLTEVTSELFLPPMLNLDALGGVSFTKGCYPGQEVIARLKYRGEVKRRLYRGRSKGEPAPRPGDRLFVAGQDAHVGEIVMAAPHPEGGHAVLAVLQPEYVDTDQVRLGTVAGPALAFTIPPYPTT